jgi:uncharacterized membrane protein YeaQ/YmgE (transglycosylase-associated protein family)
MLPWGIIAALGLLMGAATFVFVPGKVRGGILLTMVVGAIGALVMTWIGRQIGILVVGESRGFLIAVAGTALVLAVWRTTMGRAAEPQ